MWDINLGNKKFIIYYISVPTYTSGMRKERVRKIKYHSIFSSFSVWRHRLKPHLELGVVAALPGGQGGGDLGYCEGLAEWEMNKADYFGASPPKKIVKLVLPNYIERTEPAYRNLAGTQE